MRLVLDTRAGKTQARHSGSANGSGRAAPLHAIQKIGNGRPANRFDDGLRRLPRLAGQPRDKFAPHSPERLHGVGVVEPNAGRQKRCDVFRQAASELLQHAILGVCPADEVPFEGEVMVKAVEQSLGVEPACHQPLVEVEQIAVLVSLEEGTQLGAKDLIRLE